MRKGLTYKHINNTDVAALVLRIVHIPEKNGYEVMVDWLNVVNPKNVFRVGVTEEVFIKAKEMINWKLYPEITNHVL